MKNKPQNHIAARPQGGAAAHSDIVLPIVPRQVSPQNATLPELPAAKSGDVETKPSDEWAGISWTSPMGFIWCNIKRIGTWFKEALSTGCNLWGPGRY